MLQPFLMVAFTANLILLSESSDNYYCKCRANEIYVQCPDAVCLPKTCEEVGYPVPCIDLGPDGECPSNPECICKEGYVRNNLGICIPAEFCPSCGGDKNAISGCGVNCGKHCSDYFGIRRPCLKICYPNACDCRDGYYYDDYAKKCVLPQKCTPQCPVNERYERCPPALCTPQTCSQLGFPINCSDIPQDSICSGEPACVCNDGYVRNDKGVCIPVIECPSCGGDENAESGCGFACVKHCKNLYNDKPRVCRLSCILNGCTCKTGKYYDEITNKCVDPSDCTQVCPDNEELSDCVNGGCDRRNCSQLDQPKICIHPYTCEKGCVCRDGYLRHPHGYCVPIDECPPTCGENEVLNECLEGVCEATTCQELGYPFSCILSIPTTCTEGCLCIDGYLRADNGTCIPASSCPSCGGDTNAEAGCGVYCNTRCSDIGEEPKVCSAICNVNTCDCKEGYYLDENTGKCVLPENCSTTAITRTSTPVDTDVGLANLRKGNIALTGEFVYLLNKLQPGVSFVLSAISVLIPFSQLALYAYGLILEQLLRATNLDSKDEIRTVLPSLIKKYQAPTTAEFEIAIKFYVNKYYPLSETFQREAREIFSSEGENVDFGQSDEAAKIINDWVYNKTHGLIDNLVDSSMLSDDTTVVLVNAIYFWDNWKHQFNPNYTKNRDFYITPDKTKSIPTMYQESSFNYYECEDLDAQILEMPYKADNFSFVLWLPRKKDGLSNIVEKLRNPDTLIDSLNHFTTKTVKIFLPVMKIKTESNMKDLLIKANITEMFMSQSDGFKGILEKDTPLYVSDVVQQAVISVTETGTEAAAAAAASIPMSISAVYPSEIIIVDANHPYVYSVMLQGDLLFSGVFSGDL